MMKTASIPAILLGAACASSTPAISRATSPAPARHEDPGTEPAAAASAQERGRISIPLETYTLPNGMTVVLHEDRSLPKVVIDTWFAVGSKDERPGRTGFAHLFEHLMFMGTGRVPDDGFDVLMESAGGSNNATTSQDRTNYYSMGPSSILPTLLWLDADRLDALADHMTVEKLDKQRAVVRNERRQTSENVPYGKAELLLPPALYPEGHPYHHTVIGSHEDLEAATLEDVVDFFHTYYVPGNATLVIAGDFDSDAVKPIVARTFGAVSAGPLPPHRTAAPVRLEREKRLVDTDKVEFPKLILAWHSPAYYQPGDAEMDLVASILSDGRSSRLERRLVRESGLAREVAAYQASGELGSTFFVEAIASAGADLEEIEREILTILDELGAEGPTADELARVQARREADFLRDMENLLSRADAINRYRHYFGVSDGFQRDLDRWLGADADDVRRAAAAVFVEGRVDLRILPENANVEAASLDQRPADFPPSGFQPPQAMSLSLASGVPLVVVPQRGSGLFSGGLVVHGGEGSIEGGRAGLGTLTVRMLGSGAGGRDGAAFATAVESLGANLRPSGGRVATTVSVDGLASRLDATLDLFADLVLRPELDPEDFVREKELLLGDVAARTDDPWGMADLLAGLLTFGPEHPLGRPTTGFERTLAPLALADVEAALPRLLDPARALFVFAGDVDAQVLKATLDARFGDWVPGRAVEAAAPAATLETAPRTGIALFHRAEAPQSMLYVLRPLAPPDDAVERAVRAAVDTVLGGTFTSRLNANLREDKGYTYGARSRIQQEGEQFQLLATSAVRTDVTGAALGEFEREFDLMAARGIDTGELGKAVETLRRRLVERAETTGRLAASLIGLAVDGRPPDAVASDLAALDEVTLEAANAFAASGVYAWDDLLIVLVGDREAILPQLAEAGFPAPTELDAEGRPLQ